MADVVMTLHSARCGRKTAFDVVFPREGRPCRIPHNATAFSSTSRTPTATRDALTQTVRNAPAAQTFGYHEVWLADHHYRSYAISSALTLLFAHIATRFRCYIGCGDTVGG